MKNNECRNEESKGGEKGRSNEENKVTKNDGCIKNLKEEKSMEE